MMSDRLQGSVGRTGGAARDPGRRCCVDKGSREGGGGVPLLCERLVLCVCDRKVVGSKPGISRVMSPLGL